MQCAVQHRPVLYYCGVVWSEHVDGDDFHVVGYRRHDHLLDLGGFVGDAEHVGY